MKKITLTGIAITFGTLLFALPAFAATTSSFTPSTLKVATGQQFNVVVAVNPNGTSNYAEKLEVEYPASLLEVTAFNFGTNWIGLTQSGYDSIDNTNGVLIKTGGYPGGVTSLTPFGTITFTAKKSGSGTITIGNQSQAFEASGKTPITGTGIGATFVVTTGSVVPQKVLTTNKNTITTTNNGASATSTNLTPVTSINGQVVATTSAQSAAAAVAASELAAVNASTGRIGGVWTWILIILIIAIAIVVAYLILKKKNRN